MKKILIYALVCAMVSLSGCDKLKDATSRDFTVNNISFAFTAKAQDDVTTQRGTPTVTTRAAAMRTFSETRLVDISEMGSSDVVEYANKINKVVINATEVSVATVPTGNYSVVDLSITVTGVAGSLVIPAYTIGEAFTTPAGMNAYMSAFIMQLVNTKTVSVTVSGQTDAPAGTTLTVSYESDVLFTASLF